MSVVAGGFLIYLVVRYSELALDGEEEGELETVLSFEDSEAGLFFSNIKDIFFLVV